LKLLLIGARGAGKSSVAPRLAKRLDLPCVDTDAEIVACAGKPIEELFRDGTFREREREVVARALAASRGVVALGGGAVLDPGFDPGEWTVVWLVAEPDVLALRIRRDPTVRPSLTGGAPDAEVAAVLREREDRYRRLAHVTVVTDTLDVGGVVDRIVSRLR
jgi:shikimate kinase